MTTKAHPYRLHHGRPEPVYACARCGDSLASPRRLCAACATNRGAFRNLRAWPPRAARRPSARALDDAFGSNTDHDTGADDALAVLRDAFPTAGRVTFLGTAYAYTIEAVGLRTRVRVSDGGVFWITAVTDLLVYDPDRWAEVLCEAANAGRAHPWLIAGEGPTHDAFEAGRATGEW